MAVNYTSARFSAEDDNGRPLSGGRLFTYQNGTTTPAVTYKDAAGTTPNTNPIILDARGEAVVHLQDAQVYRFVLQNRFGSLVWSQDAIAGSVSTTGFSEFLANLLSGAGAGLIGLNATTGYVQGTIGFRDTREVFVTDFPWLARSDGSDCTARINNALTWMGTQSGGGKVRIPRGVFCQTALIKVPANVSLVMDSGAELKCLNNIANDPSVPGSAHQGQSVALMGNRSEIIGGLLNGNTFNAGGVVASAVQNIVIDGVSVKDSGRGTAEYGGAQAFHLFAVTDFEVRNIDSNVSLHGVQMWACTNGRVFGCKVNRFVGGIWTAACTNVVVFGCEITNGEDVGLDFEGGQTCYGYGNIVASCKNAELSIFQDAVGNGVGCKSLVLSGNQVHRTATYIKRDGTTESTAGGAAMWFASLNNFAYDVGFRRNDILVDADSGYVWLVSAEFGAVKQIADITENNIFFNGTGALFAVTALANGLRHNDNKYYLNQGVNVGSVFKNVKFGEFSNNEFLAAAPPSVPLIRLYSDQAAQQSCMVADNKFTGCGDNAMFVDQFNSGYGTFILSNNDLTDSPQPNGGLQINVGNDAPRYIKQTIYLAEKSTGPSVTVDFDQLQHLRASQGALRPTAEILYVINIGGATRNSYPLHYLFGSLRSIFGIGAGSGTNIAAADVISSISSVAGAMTVSKTASTDNRSMIKLTLDSSYVP